LNTAIDERNKAHVQGSGAAVPGLIGALADIVRI
jgi:hypothetical protein